MGNGSPVIWIDFGTDSATTWSGTDFTWFKGEAYSSQWFWAKVLHIGRARAPRRQRLIARGYLVAASGCSLSMGNAAYDRRALSRFE